MLKKLLFLAAVLAGIPAAQAQAPNVIPGCVYNLSTPTLADKQTIALQCDVNGKLKTTGGGGGGGSPGGSNTQVQYNNSGAFGGITGATSNGTTLTLVAPILGAATATSINKVTITAPATASTLTIADGKTLAVSNTLTLAGTDSSTLNIGAGGTIGGAGYATPAAGIVTFLTTPSSANLGAALTDKTGTGVNVFATTPTLVTPVLGVATATSINKTAITAPATSSTLAVADGKTFTVNNTLTLNGTDGTTMTFPTTSATIARTDAAQTFTGVQTFAGNVVPNVDAGSTLGTPSVGFGNVYSAGNVRIGTNGLFYFTSKGEFGASVDGTFFYRNGAETIQTFFSIPANATWQHGAANAAAPVAQLISFQGARGGTDTNTAGVNDTITPSLGTGTGAPGQFIINGAIGATTGTGQHTTAAALTVAGVVNGQLPSVVLGSAALGTTATDGFLYIATSAGPPTGVPTTFTGRVALDYDTTNHKLWIFDGSWLQPKTPAGAAIVTWQ